MEISEQKQYDLDGGKIRIHRHFGKTERSSELVRNGVIFAAKELELLTDKGAHAILPMSLREPQ